MAYYQGPPDFEGYLADTYEDDPVFAGIARDVAESQFNVNKLPEEQYGDEFTDQWPEEYYNETESCADMQGVDQYVDHPFNYPGQEMHQVEYQLPSESTYDGMDSPTPQPVRDAGRRNTHLPTMQMQQRIVEAGSFNKGFGPDLHAVPAYTNQYRSEMPLSQPGGPHVAEGIKLVPVSQLPDMYRAIFKFGVFNAIQSKCFPTIMTSKDNLVISAPTGSGKTVLFELALIDMLMNQHPTPGGRKCVYMAPTKALCSERYRDWSSKFDSIGVKCCEMTGDTVQFGKRTWADAKNATVIITTAEKWDSLTRNWDDYEPYFNQVQLFLVDEVHILNESRGSTLEVVISRMRMRGLAVRFVLVSATVPNIHDVAEWIGNQSFGQGGAHSPASVFEFGSEYRPCKLSRSVYGFPRRGQNDFQFARLLEFKLFSTLQQHPSGKPILVFCSTRKGVISTAEQLLKDYEHCLESRQSAPWTVTKRSNTHFNDKRLEKFVTAGIGVHHAGLTLDDRRTTEDLFLNGTIRIVVATSTLAVGVNLRTYLLSRTSLHPVLRLNTAAHTVVIKGVKLFQNNAWREYSDLDIVQMMGRAGRPQFDKEGVAIIMCEAELQHKYQNMLHGQTVLESSLHTNLSEHINSEIGLGTITNLQSAQSWLHKSFLFRRITKNPAHYGVKADDNQDWQDRLDALVSESIKKLKDTGLVSDGLEGERSLRSTELGEIMSKYYIRQTTMSNIQKIQDTASLREILECISCSDELGDIRLRGGDKQIYNRMREHQDIRFRLKKIERASDKVFILIQAVLGGIPLNSPEYKTADSQPTLDALSIFRHVARIARVVVEVSIVKKCGSQLKHGLELVRCLTAKAWEDRPVVLRQIESIGEKSIKVLAENGICSLQSLRRQEPAQIELLLNRKSPFGHEILAYLNEMPQYFVTIKEDSLSSFSGKKPVSVEFTVHCGLREPMTSVKHRKNVVKSSGMTNILTLRSDLTMVDFRRISTKALKDSKSFSVTAELTKPSQTIMVLISPDGIAGLTVTSDYKPALEAMDYPIRDTRPLNCSEQEVADLEESNFWSVEDIDEVDCSQTGNTQKHASPLKNKRRPTMADNNKNNVERIERGPDNLKLHNGKYRCNHSCKDKRNCRHLCCREGLDKPPVRTRGDSATARNHITSHGKDENITNGPANVGYSKVPSSNRSVTAKVDKRLDELEALHDKVNVEESLRLPKGRRLILDGELKKLPTFDLELGDLVHSGISDDSDGEDVTFPEAEDLLATSAFAPAPALTTPSALEAESGEVPPPKSIYAKTKGLSITPTLSQGVDELPCKRAWISPSSSPSKKAKYTSLSTQMQQNVTNIPVTPRRRIGSSHTVEPPLFLPGSEETYSSSKFFNDFVLDNSLFDIVDLLGSPHTPVGEPTSVPPITQTISSKITPPPSTTHQNPGDDQMESKKEKELVLGLEDLHEFEEWLRSGSVQIVDNT